MPMETDRGVLELDPPPSLSRKSGPSLSSIADGPLTLRMDPRNAGNGKANGGGSDPARVV